jgi:hypothetical protein
MDSRADQENISCLSNPDSLDIYADMCFLLFDKMLELLFSVFPPYSPVN